MGYDTVIFDLDGTLLDTLDDLMDSCNYALSTIGAPPRTRAEIRRFVGNGIRNLMKLAVPGGEEHPRFEEAYTTMQSWYKAHNQIKTAPYPGVQKLIQTLRKREIPMAVVSNKPDASVQMLMRQWFPEITIGVGEMKGLRRKPARDMVDYALDKLGNPEAPCGLGGGLGGGSWPLPPTGKAGLHFSHLGLSGPGFARAKGCAGQFADTAEELLDLLGANVG